MTIDGAIVGSEEGLKKILTKNTCTQNKNETVEIYWSHIGKEMIGELKLHGAYRGQGTGNPKP